MDQGERLIAQYFMPCRSKQWIAGCFSLFLFSVGGHVIAQIPPDATPDQIDKIRKEAQARRELYEELKKEVTARQELQALQDAGRQAIADQSLAAKAAKELAEAQTAAATAQKAQSDAAIAAAKARFGEIPASGYSGAVDLGTGAGNAEGMLLGAAAISEIAEKFAIRISTDLGNRPKVLLFSSAAAPDFQALTVFNLQYESLKQAVVSARKNAESIPRAAGRVETESVGTIGLGLDAINKLLAFAKTDYKFSGIEISSTDSMLVSALAGELRKIPLPPTGQKAATNQAQTALATPRIVEIPSMYIPEYGSLTTPVMVKLAEMHKWSAEAKSTIRLLEAEQVNQEKKAAAAPKDQDAQKNLQKQQETLAVWKTVSDMLNASLQQISSTDDKGIMPLAYVVRQGAIKQRLETGATLVFIQLHKVAGSAFTKKNLMSSLGANPFYVMGGAVASYVALDGQSGETLSAMLLPLHGGYHSVSRLKDVINSGSE